MAGLGTGVKRVRRGSSVLEIRDEFNANADVLESILPQNSGDIRVRIGKGGAQFFLRKRIIGGGTGPKPGFILYSNAIDNDPDPATPAVSIDPDGSFLCGIRSDTTSTLVPEIGGISIQSDPRPQLAVANGQIVALKLELEPVGEEYKNINDEIRWKVGEGYDLIGDRVDVVTLPGPFVVEDQWPAVDDMTGTPTQNGIYHIPLARVAVTGDVVTFPYKYFESKGPLGASYCTGGFLNPWGAIQMRRGALQTFEDDPPPS